MSTSAMTMGEMISEKVNMPAKPTERFLPMNPTMALTAT